MIIIHYKIQNRMKNRMKKITKYIIQLVFLFNVTVFAASDPIVATYTGGKIKESEVVKAFNPIFSEGGPFKDKKFSDLDKEVQKDLVNKYVSHILFQKEAESSKIDQTKKFKDMFEEIKKRLLVEAYFKEKFDKEITKDMINSEYKKKIKELKGKKEAKILIILVEKSEEMKDITKRLNKGEKFEDIAKHLSNKGINKAPTKSQNVAQGSIPLPELEKEIFATKLGKISKPIESPLGNYIVKVENLKDATIPSKDESEPEIVKNLQADILEKHSNYLFTSKNVKILIE